MQLFTRLKGRFPALRLEKEFSFSHHTTIGCGGTAAVAAYPASLEESACLIAYLIRERIPMCLLGAGANVLPSEGYFENGRIVKSR